MPVTPAGGLASHVSTFWPYGEIDTRLPVRWYTACVPDVGVCNLLHAGSTKALVHVGLTLIMPISTSVAHDFCTMKPEMIEAVSARGQAMPEADSAHRRQDACGAWMRREPLGRANCELDWKGEEANPGGDDMVENLRPSHWRNGYDIANSRPHRRVAPHRLSVPAKECATPRRNREL